MIRNEIALRMMKGLHDNEGNPRTLGKGYLLRVGPRSSINNACYEMTLDALLMDTPHYLRQEKEQKLLKNATIVCTTLSSCGHWYFDETDLKFDIVIIDEAVQGVEADMLIALTRSRQRCVMVGDPCQLPATVFQYPAFAFRRSLFERMQEAGVAPHFLDTQYRMHSLISYFPSRQFYNGALKDATEIQARNLTLDKTHSIRAGVFHFKLDYYTFLDLGWGVDALDNDSRSRFNNEEAKAVASVVRGVLKNVKGTVTVGVVTPYACQKALILNQLSPQERSCCEVNTIDGFQGREKDVIVVSCVRANQHKGVGFVSDERRMNVALTRAKSILIIIGHAETLEHKSAAWRALIRDARSRGLYQALSNNKRQSGEDHSEEMKDQMMVNSAADAVSPVGSDEHHRDKSMDTGNGDMEDGEIIKDGDRQEIKRTDSEAEIGAETEKAAGQGTPIEACKHDKSDEDQIEVGESRKDMNRNKKIKRAGDSEARIEPAEIRSNETKKVKKIKHVDLEAEIDEAAGIRSNETEKAAKKDGQGTPDKSDEDQGESRKDMNRKKNKKTKRADSEAAAEIRSNETKKDSEAGFGAAEINSKKVKKSKHANAEAGSGAAEIRSNETKKVRKIKHADPEAGIDEAAEIGSNETKEEEAKKDGDSTEEARKPGNSKVSEIRKGSNDDLSAMKAIGWKNRSLPQSKEGEGNQGGRKRRRHKEERDDDQTVAELATESDRNDDAPSEATLKRKARRARKKELQKCNAI